MTQKEGGELPRWKSIPREGAENTKVGAQRQLGTRHKILEVNRKQADGIINDRAGAASCFLLCQLQPLADPSIQLLFPQNHVLGKGFAAGPRGASPAQR